MKVIAKRKKFFFADLFRRMKLMDGKKRFVGIPLYFRISGCVCLIRDPEVFFFSEMFTSPYFLKSLC